MLNNAEAVGKFGTKMPTAMAVSDVGVIAKSDAFLSHTERAMFTREINGWGQASKWHGEGIVARKSSFCH